MKDSITGILYPKGRPKDSRDHEIENAKICFVQEKVYDLRRGVAHILQHQLRYNGSDRKLPPEYADMINNDLPEAFLYYTYGKQSQTRVDILSIVTED